MLLLRRAIRLLSVKYPLFADNTYALETARLVSEAAAEHMYKLLNETANKKQISDHEAVNKKLIYKNILPLAEKYFTDSAKGYASGSDVYLADFSDSNEFIRQVLRPALTSVFRAGPRYQGFGPNSYFSKLRYITRSVPWEQALMLRYNEAR